MATVLLLYILQKYSEKVEIFEGLLACSVSWCKNSWQWWHSHLVCVCVVITDCKKLKKFFVHVHTKFCGNWWTGRKIEMGGGGNIACYLRSLHFLGRKESNKRPSVYWHYAVPVLCWSGVQTETLIFLLCAVVPDSVLCHFMLFLHVFVILHVHRLLSNYIRPHCVHDCIL